MQLASGANSKLDEKLDIPTGEDEVHLIKRRSAPESTDENTHEDTHSTSLHGKSRHFSSSSNEQANRILGLNYSHPFTNSSCLLKTVPSNDIPSMWFMSNNPVIYYINVSISALCMVNFTDLLPLLSSLCKDGRDGRDGKDGINGVNGKDGKDGINGKDGRLVYLFTHGFFDYDVVQKFKIFHAIIRRQTHD